MKQSLSINTILIIVIALVVLINIAVVGNFILNRNGGGRAGAAGSTIGMKLTQPVYSLSGTVRSVGENRMEVEYLVMNASTQGQETSSPQAESLRFRVAIAPETKVFVLRNPVPYVLVEQADQPQVSQTEGSLSDIAEGDTVSITSTTDLRSLQQPEFVAQSISVSSALNGLSGTVRSVAGNTLTVEGTRIGSPIANTPQTQTFTVQISNNTEIARLNNPSPDTRQTAAAISLSDLRRDSVVTVYFEPTNGTTVNALSVQALPNPSQGQNQQQATGSAQSATSVTPSVQPEEEE